jgi:cytochrome c553
MRAGGAYAHTALSLLAMDEAENRPAAENRVARAMTAQDIEEAAAYYASQEIVKATD